MRNVITIIPARGGSKGIPMKNVQLVGGTSLIARSVITAREAFPEYACFVVTDCPAIAEEASDREASVLELPKSLATDTSPSSGTLQGGAS